MINNFDGKPLDDFQKFGKDSVDASLKAFSAASRSAQAIAVETVDYSKKSFEDGSAAMEKLLGARSLDKAIEIQQDYLKNAYDGFVAQATKLGELYTEFAREAYKPYEGYLARVAPAAK